MMAKRKAVSALQNIQAAENKRANSEAEAKAARDREIEDSHACSLRLLGAWPRVGVTPSGKVFPWTEWHAFILKFCDQVRMEKQEVIFISHIRQLLALETMGFSPADEDMFSLLQAGLIGNKAGQMSQGIEEQLEKLSKAGRREWARSFDHGRQWLYLIQYPEIESRQRAAKLDEARKLGVPSEAKPIAEVENEILAETDDGCDGVPLSGIFSAEDWGGFFYGAKNRKTARQFLTNRTAGKIRARKVGRKFRVPIRDLPSKHPEALKKPDS